MAFLRWVAVCCGLATSLAFIYGTLSADLAVEVWKNPKTPAMHPLIPGFSHEKQAPSLKWKVLGLFCGAHATWKTGIGMLGKEALLDFGLKCLSLENE